MEVSRDSDLSAWAETKGISRSTLKVLQVQGVMAVQDLALLDLSVLEASDIVTSEQCQVLGRVVDELLYTEDLTVLARTQSADFGTDTVTLSAGSGTDTVTLSVESDADTVASHEEEPDLSTSLDEKIEDQWAEAMGVTKHTLALLHHQGVTSRQDLLDLDIALLDASDLVPPEQCIQLEKARHLLLTERDAPGSMCGSPPEIDSELSPSHLVDSFKSTEEELTRWARLHGVTQETLGVLREQGVASLQDLPSLDVGLLEQLQLVPEEQCLLLVQARDRLLTGNEEFSFLPLCNSASDTAIASSILGECDGASSPQTLREVCVADIKTFGLDPPRERQLLVGDVDDRVTYSGGVDDRVTYSGDVDDRVTYSGDVDDRVTYSGDVDDRVTYSGDVDDRVTYSGDVDDRVTYSGGVDDRVTYSHGEALTVISRHQADSLVDCRRDHRASTENVFRFFLVGKTGCGKSTTGNTILGKELFTQEVSFSSVTSTCSFQWCNRKGTVIEITDSPGLCDTKRPPQDVARDVVQAVACMHPGPTAILYVVSISRYTEEDHGVYRRLKSLFDPEVAQYIIVIFTRGDELKRRETTIEDVLRTAPDNLSKTLEECGGRYLVFDNTADDKQPQVDNLIEQVRKLSEKHGDKPYACPKYGDVGGKMERELQRRLQKVEEEEVKRKKYVQDLEENMKKVREESEREKRDFERKERERVEMKMKAKKEHEKQMKELMKQLEKQQLSTEKEKMRVEKLKEDYENFMKEMKRTKREDLDRIREMDRLVRKQAASLEREKASKRRLQKQEVELRKLKEKVSRKNSSFCSVM